MLYKFVIWVYNSL